MRARDSGVRSRSSVLQGAVPSVCAVQTVEARDTVMCGRAEPNPYMRSLGNIELQEGGQGTHRGRPPESMRSVNSAACGHLSIERGRIQRERPDTDHGLDAYRVGRYRDRTSALNSSRSGLRRSPIGGPNNTYERVAQVDRKGAHLITPSTTAATVQATFKMGARALDCFAALAMTAWGNVSAKKVMGGRLMSEGWTAVRPGVSGRCVAAGPQFGPDERCEAAVADGRMTSKPGRRPWIGSLRSQ